MTRTDLHVTLARGPVRLEPMAERHREPLRAACARDREIWQIYSSSLLGEHFDPQFDLKLAGPQLAWAVFDGDGLVGCSSFYDIQPEHRALAIGYTYLAPEVRGSGFNLAKKGLLIGHARACGFHRIHFDIDVRNTRSQAAVTKLGATREGVLRKNRITWNGHHRDTAVFSLLPGEESDLLKPHL